VKLTIALESRQQNGKIYYTQKHSSSSLLFAFAVRKEQLKGKMAQDCTAISYVRSNDRIGSSKERKLNSHFDSIKPNT
jgi:hypothetical protein